MSLTEVVYKIRSEGHPLCDLTASHGDLKVIINQMSWDARKGTSRALVTVLGEADLRDEVEQALPDAYDVVEAVDEGTDQLNLQVEAGIKKLRSARDPRAFTLGYFGDGAVIEPVMVKDGYAFSRVVVPGEVDLASMLESYEAGVEDGFWDDFKLIRIEDFDPELHAEGSFTENLTQKQLEVIKTGLALGFYNTPRDITLDDLSSIFGISKAAVHNRLQAAERKVISKFFG